MKKKSMRIVTVGLCLLLLYGCGTALSENGDDQGSDGASVALSTSTVEPAGTPSPTPTISPTPEPTPTESPTPTPEPDPTETPSPTPTLTPTPSPTPTPEPTITPTDTPTAAPVVENDGGNGGGSGNSGNTGSSGNGGDSNFNTYNNTEQQNTEDTWVLNTNSKKIHYPSCKSVPKIAPQNYSTSSETLDELKSRGYTTCGNCFK